MALQNAHESETGEPEFDPKKIMWPARDDITYMEDSFSIILMPGYLSVSDPDSWPSSPNFDEDVARIREDFDPAVSDAFVRLVHEGIRDADTLIDYGIKLDRLYAMMLAYPGFPTKGTPKQKRDAVLNFYKNEVGLDDKDLVNIYDLKQADFSVGIDRMLLENPAKLGNCTVCASLLAYSLSRTGLEVNYHLGRVDAVNQPSNGHIWLSAGKSGDVAELESTQMYEKPPNDLRYRETSRTAEVSVIGLHNRMVDVLDQKRTLEYTDVLAEISEMEEADPDNIDPSLLEGALELEMRLARKMPNGGDKYSAYLDTCKHAASVLCAHPSSISLQMSSIQIGVAVSKYTRDSSGMTAILRALGDIQQDMDTYLGNGRSGDEFVRLFVTKELVSDKQDYLECVGKGILGLQPRDLTREQWDSCKRAFASYSNSDYFVENGPEIYRHITQCCQSV